MKKVILTIALLLGASFLATAQNAKEIVAAEAGNPALLKPNYSVPYGPTTVAAITEVLDRIHGYLDATTPTRVIDRVTGAEITDFTTVNTNAIVERGDFPIISYEWGVTYSGMLHAYETTGDPRFRDYVAKRMQFIVAMTPYFQKLDDAGVRGLSNSFRSVLHPGALDDAGSMCAAMIKAQQAKLIDARPLIDNYVDYIMTKQYRLADGTLARQRPMADSLWLDDLFMSVPALAQMGKLTGDKTNYDEAAKQFLQFSKRMFDLHSGLYMHGWIAGMSEHPEFHWARANGWALLAATELLDVLPENHPARSKVLTYLRLHIRGLQAVQSESGLWHQLLDRDDSYLETSASAIYTYCIAHAINRGWIDALAYGPTVQLAWNGIATKVNAQGQVEGTCVGTGMGFDPAYYYHRPQSVRAAHGYGPMLLAGAEMIVLTKSDRGIINDGAMQFGHQPTNTESAK